MAERLVLALFVTYENRHRAMANLSLALQEVSDNSYHVFECDVREYPEVSEDLRVLATPTLIRFWPAPRIEIVGDLSETVKVRRILLTETEHEPTLVHKLYAKQDVRHEELADRLRQAELAKWEQFGDSPEDFPFCVMESMSVWAKRLAEREMQIRRLEKNLPETRANSSTQNVNKPRRANA